MMAFSKTRNGGPEDVPLLKMNQREALIQIFVSPPQTWGSVHVTITATAEM